LRPPLFKIGFHRSRLLHTLGLAALQGRLPSVANAQNPGHKGWVSQEETP
jgi:hypothetical protein